MKNVTSNDMFKKHISCHKVTIHWAYFLKPQKLTNFFLSKLLVLYYMSYNLPSILTNFCASENREPNSKC